MSVDRVAIFASSFHPHIGGVEELVRQLAREYRGRGIHTVVITNRWPRHLPGHELVDGIPVHRLPFRVPEGSLKARVNYAATSGAIKRRLIRLLRQENIELIHVQCVSTNGHYAAFAAEALGLPLIVTAQGERTMDATDVYSRSAFLNATLRRLLERADHVTACSADTLRDLDEYRGEPLGKRGSVVWNGIALDDFVDPTVRPYGHDRPYVLALGRLVPQKGFDLLIEAFAGAATEEAFGHDLLIAGEGPEHASLVRQIDEAGATGRVHLLGPADRATVKSLFRGCSFFVLPSRQEPFGIVNAEAMAAGKAVIATAVGGVPEVVENERNGLLVHPHVKALSAAMSRLAADPELRESLARNGRRRADEFTWSRIGQSYLDLYEAVCERRREGA